MCRAELLDGEKPHVDLVGEGLCWIDSSTVSLQAIRCQSEAGPAKLSVCAQVLVSHAAYRQIAKHLPTLPVVAHVVRAGDEGLEFV